MAYWGWSHECLVSILLFLASFHFYVGYPFIFVFSFLWKQPSFFSIFFMNLVRGCLCSRCVVYLEFKILYFPDVFVSSLMSVYSSTLLQVFISFNFSIFLGYWLCIKDSRWNYETLLAVLLEYRKPRKQFKYI